MAGTGSVTATSKAVGNNQYDVTVKFRIAFDWGGWNSNGASYTIWCDGQSLSGSATFSVPSGNGSWQWTDIATKTFRITMPTSGQSKTISFSATINTGVTPATISASNKTTLAARTWLWTVSYNANGGTSAPSSQTKSKGTTLKLSTSIPVRDGYTFIGWNTDKNGGGTTYSAGGNYTADAAVTLYAQWRIITYTVNYDANGGYNQPSPQTKNHGQELILTSARPARQNYNFMGWGLSPTSTTVSYSPSGKYTNNANITLYAIWSIAYIKPIVTNFKVDRSDSSGNLLEEGTNAKVVFNWKTEKSANKVVVKASPKTGSGAPITKEISLYGTSGNISTVIGNNGLSTDLEYNISVTVYDVNGSETYYMPLPQLKYLIDFNEDGVSFGKPASLRGVVDISYATRFEGGIDYIKIPRGADLNNYTKTGFYYCPYSTDAENIANMPSERVAFSLEVIKHSGVHQRLITYPSNNFNVYMRQYYNGIWGEWVKCISSNMLGDYVVDSGSNAYGDYRKWNSGRLEMWGTKAFSNIAINNRTGVLYNSVHQSIAFPVTSLTRVTAVLSSYSNTGGFCSTSIGTDMKGSVGFWFYLGTSVASSDHTVHWKAEGTWK